MRWLGLLALAACGRLGFDPTSPAADDVVERTLTLPAPTANLADFVAYVQLDDFDVAGRVRDDGADLRFVDANGTPLAHELASWDAARGRLSAWVRIPTLTAGVPPTIGLRYGGNATAATPMPVWSNVAGAVWHFDEPSPPFQDSATAPNEAAPLQPAATPASTAGIVGSALLFDGVDDVLFADDPADGSLDFGVSSFSVEIWVLVTASSSLYDIAFWKGGSSMNYPGYDIELGVEYWTFNLNDGTGLSFATDFGVEADFLGRWTQLVGVADRQAQETRVYANGQLRMSLPITVGSVDSANPVRFGGDMYPFKGTLDEVRIYPGVLPAASIALSYELMTQPAQAITIGEERPVP